MEINFYYLTIKSLHRSQDNIYLVGKKINWEIRE
jgi:hypothetical protein